MHVIRPDFGKKKVGNPVRIDLTDAEYSIFEQIAEQRGLTIDEYLQKRVDEILTQAAQEEVLPVADIVPFRAK